MIAPWGWRLINTVLTLGVFTLCALAVTGVIPIWVPLITLGPAFLWNRYEPRARRRR